MPKKGGKGPFYLFMLNFEKEERAKGRQFANREEVSEAAGSIWETLSADNKAYYIKLAKKQKNGEIVKYNSLGQRIDDVTKAAQDKINERRNMETYITRLVDDGQDFVERHFFVVYVNHYCYHGGTDRYYPAEITVVRFNLCSGADIDDIFHAVIEPEPLPLGYRLAANQLTEEFHALPAYQDDPGYDDITRIGSEEAFKSLRAFLMKYTEANAPMPPLYVGDEDKDQTENIVKMLLTQNGFSENYLRIYSLTFLFYILRNAAHMKISNDPCFPTVTLADKVFERDTYEYIKEISCKFHSTTELYRNCTMSRALRKIFLICDYTLPDLDIDMIPGRHVPVNADRKKLYNIPEKKKVEQVASKVTREAESLSRPTSRLSIDAPEFVAGATKFPLLTNKPTPQNDTLGQGTRRPVSTSKVWGVRPNIVPELSDDFPALGAPNAPKPFGRGRGRILSTNFNK